MHELAALGTALCWAFSSLIGAVPSGQLGAFTYSRLRQTSVVVLLAIYVLATQPWRDFSLHSVSLLLLSGFIGIFFGDTLLFLSLNRLGPRRTGVLFALNAPISAVLGWLFLAEALPTSAMSGIGLTIFGVMLTIFFGHRAGQAHQLETVRGPLWIGVVLGLAAALGQAIGSIVVRPVMQAGFDPIVASFLRIGCAALCLNLLMALPIKSVRAKTTLNWKLAALTIFAGFLAMGVGMTLLLYALSGGKTGIVSTLSATSPVVLLPLLWISTGQRPTPGAWAGAFCVVAGLGLIFLNR